MRRYWVRVGIWLAVWTVIGAFFSVQTYVSQSYGGVTISWWEAGFLGLSEWYTWALLSPLLIWTAKRFPFGRDSWVRSLAVHLPVALVATALKSGAHSAIVDASRIARPEIPGVAAFNVSLLTCGLILGVAHALNHDRISRERLQRALELESRLVRARLQLLKTQLQPHFLFNTLHSISTLMHRDLDAAETMLTRLSDLLRMALDRGEAEQVAFKAELEFTRLYLQIQEVRFRDRLRVSYDIAPETLDAGVPAMVLQPLAENAIRHGLDKRASSGVLEIASRVDGSRLQVIVRDDGPGLSGNGRGELREGVGLGNTRARLESLYGEAQSLRLSDASGGGLQVTLELPFRRIDAEEPAGPPR